MAPPARLDPDPGLCNTDSATMGLTPSCPPDQGAGRFVSSKDLIEVAEKRAITMAIARTAD